MDNTKSTNAEIELRITEIHRLLLDGYSRSEILQYPSVKAWKITARQVDTYISEANKIIQETSQADRSGYAALITKNYWNLFRAAKASDNLQEAHKILNSIAKIKGLDQQTINHFVNDSRELSAMTDDDLDKLLQDAAGEQH